MAFRPIHRMLTVTFLAAALMGLNWYTEEGMKSEKTTQ